MSVDLAVPGTVFFEQDFMLRQTSVDNGTKWLSRTVWLAPFSVGGVGLHLDGLVLIKSTDNFGTNSFSQIDLLADVIEKGRLQVGVRLESAKMQDAHRCALLAYQPFSDGEAQLLAGLPSATHNLVGQP